MPRHQFTAFRAAGQIINDLISDQNNVVVIHYSCESFYDRPDGSSPRITSIAVRHFGSGQTESFSIHQEAELQGIRPESIEAYYNELELSMLNRFEAFVRQNASKKWVHWNMRDGNYGFQAIAHRHRVLGGNPALIQDSHKIDLARILHDFLGPKYQPHPRLENLLKAGDMVPRNFLNGSQEAEAFEDGEFVKLHQSTLCKVDAFANIIESADANRLSTVNGYWERRGLTYSTALELVKDHPIVVTIGCLASIATTVVGIIQIF